MEGNINGKGPNNEKPDDGDVALIQSGAETEAAKDSLVEDEKLSLEEEKKSNIEKRRKEEIQSIREIKITLDFHRKNLEVSKDGPMAKQAEDYITAINASPLDYYTGLIDLYKTMPDPKYRTLESGFQNVADKIKKINLKYDQELTGENTAAVPDLSSNQKEASKIGSAEIPMAIADEKIPVPAKAEIKTDKAEEAQPVAKSQGSEFENKTETIQKIKDKIATAEKIIRENKQTEEAILGQLSEIRGDSVKIPVPAPEKSKAGFKPLSELSLLKSDLENMPKWKIFKRKELEKKIALLEGQAADKKNQ